MDSNQLLLSASMALHFGRSAWDYVENRNNKTSERLVYLSDRVERLEKELAELRATAESAPNHGDLAKLYDSLNHLASTVNQLVGENRGQSDTLRLILNHITHKGLQ
jgi:hypothetical protein